MNPDKATNISSLLSPIWLIPAALVLACATAWLVWRSPAAGRLILVLNRRVCRMASYRLTTGDCRWHYLAGGHGPPLVLLHGFGADADHWCHIARHLTGRFHVIAPDLPGWGDTPPPQHGGLSMEAQAERLFRFLDALRLERVYLGGNSMGGYIAVAMARARPDRIRALWLLAPGGLRALPHSPLLAEIEAGRHNPLVVRNSTDFDQLLDYCYPNPPRLPGPIRRLLVRRAAGSVDLQRRAFDAMRYESTDLESMARGLDTPALVVWGRRDRVLNPGGLDILSGLFTRCRCVMINDTGHLPMLEHPAREARRWQAFIDDPDASGRVESI